MATKSLLSLCIIGLLFTLSFTYKLYEGHKVVRIVPKSTEQLASLRSLHKISHLLELDFWKDPSAVNKPVDISIPKDKLELVTSVLSSSNLAWKVTVENLQSIVERSKNEFDNRSIFKKGAPSANFTLDEYHSQQEINDWIDSLATTYPSFVSVFSIGKSHEGRDTRVIKIGAAGTNKKGFWIDSLTHAREWITGGTTNYIINELTAYYATNPTYKNLVDKIDFYLLPVLNPDGYEYTQTNERNWRKTRSGPYRNNRCYGVDANRNWDNHWGESGASNEPCSDTYEGPKAASEVEVQNVANWLLANADKVDAFVSMHSFGDLFMYPYAWAQKTYPPNVDQLISIAKQAVAAIKTVNGTVYTDRKSVV